MTNHIPPVDRRSFLATGALGAFALALGAPDADAQSQHKPVRAPQNLIFMVSDGMSIGTLHLANLALAQRQGRDSHWVELIKRPDTRRALMDTSAADSLVTDSAAATSAWSVGEPINNGAICITPDGREMSPIWLRAKEAGRATGLVTTTRLSHATPAGFIANVPSRNMEGAIAEQMLERPVDVLLGGGAKHFDPLIAAKPPDITIVRERKGLAAINPDSHKGRLLGLFNRDHMSYELDRPDTEPTIAEMTRTALALLARSPGGFALHVEGGRVDHAAHSNDAASLIADQVAFDDALGVAIDFCAARDDTLLIVTTDHANANPGLTEYGETGNRGFERIHSVKRSFDFILQRIAEATGPNRTIDPDHLRQIVVDATAVQIDSDETDVLQRWIRGEPVTPYRSANKNAGPLGAVLANYFGVAFLSPNHTADYVEVTACGPGCELLPPFLRIHELHTVLCRALDLPPARPL